VSSLFYRGPDAHVCQSCGARFELADPALDRRSGHDRRRRADAGVRAEWRTGEDRRRVTGLDPKIRLPTPAAA
jgi:hypothetical protein